MRSLPTRWRGPAALAVGLLLVAPAAAWALNPLTMISQYATDAWLPVDGLPQASVGAIAQTVDGYVWLATEEGLVRFDGVHFGGRAPRWSPSASVFREFNELLGCVQAKGTARPPALAASVHDASRLAREICGDCVPREFAPALRTWMDQIQRMAGEVEQI